MKTMFDIIEKDTIFFDLETTGTTITKDKIVELGAVKYKMDGSTETLHKYFNPQVEICQEAYEKHGLSNEFLSDKPLFKDVAEDLFKFFEGCDIGGFNVVKFDLAFIYEEFMRCGLKLNFLKINMLDSFMLQNKYEPRTLEATYKRMFNETFENAHNAVADINATIRVFEKQYELYGLDNMKASDISKVIRSTQMNEAVVDLSGFFRKGLDGSYYYEKGKHRNKKVTCDLGYLSWLAYDSDFERNVKDVAIMFLNGITSGKIKN